MIILLHGNAYFNRQYSVTLSFLTLRLNHSSYYQSAPWHRIVIHNTLQENTYTRDLLGFQRVSQSVSLFGTHDSPIKYNSYVMGGRMGMGVTQCIVR